MKLGDIAEVIAGQSPEGKYYNEEGIGTPFHQGKTEFGDIYLREAAKWTTQVTKIAKAGDIVMSVRAPVGPVNIVKEEICIGRGLAAIRARGNVDQEFLFRFLKSMEDSISGSGGAVFDSINQGQIRDIELPLPSLGRQQELVVKALEEESIIDANRKLVELMEGKINVVIRELTK